MSLTNQPSLANLVSEVRRGDRRLVILVGAGVSMDAGLPSWEELVARLERQLKGSRAKAFEVLGSADLQRRTQQILYLSRKQPGNTTDTSRVLEALLDGSDEPPPGQMAEALARLVAVYSSDVEVLTTNFDPILERAITNLGMDGQSYSLDGLETSPGSRLWDLEAWNGLSPLERSTSVLHLHGMLNAADVLGPVILTEAEFAQHGSRVQNLLTERISDSLVIVVGMGLTDPNIVMPLRNTRAHQNSARYILSVAAHSKEQLAALKPDAKAARFDYATFVVENAEMISKDLDVRPIILKSYGQIIQLLSDLSLAHVEPKRYLRSISPSSRSLVYGSRLSSSLQELHSDIGFGPRSGKPLDNVALGNLSKTLYDAVHQRGGPLSKLAKWRRKYFGQVVPQENFGFFVWLRDPGGSRDTGAYQIRLIASSTYSHWEEWSARNIQDVTVDSKYTPALAVFNGEAAMQNVDADIRGIWSGSLAIPLVQYLNRSNAYVNDEPLDRLTIGAVSINTTASVDVGDDETRDISVLAKLDNSETAKLHDSLFEVAEVVFGR